MAALSGRRKARLLVTDLDNTLWDWFDVWYHSFSAMLDKLVSISGVPRDVLEREIRLVHQQRGTAEYSILLNELPSLQKLASSEIQPLVVFDDAVHAQNRERVARMRLYPGVRDTFLAVRSEGVPIVAYSESLSYWTEWRIRKTGLDGLIDVLYTSPDHDFPDGQTPGDFRTRSPDEYGLKTRHEHVPRGQLKPNPKVLGSILHEFDTSPEQAVYVGDSLMKDVAMAQQVGAIDVHAAYGVTQNRPEYDLLRRVSHWTADDIERERRILDGGGREIQPSYVLRTSFAELLDHFDFTLDA